MNATPMNANELPGEENVEPLNRRELFTGLRKALLAATGALAAGGAAQMMAHSSQPEPSTVATAGRPEDYTAPGLTFVREARAYLVRDDLGFYALDAVCSHLGCLVRAVGDGQNSPLLGFECPCHNSRYDAQGQRISGPAPRGLRYLVVELDSAGNLVIHRDRETHPDDRLIA
jgi:nitrite reductase/ring-hydroxylating ferredoxin subunit